MKRIANPANLLTLSRILIVPFFVWTLLMDTAGMTWLALLLFVIAAWTDYFDGLLARRYQAVSNFGKILDPVADKILVLSALSVFAAYGIMPVWMFVVILSREIAITSIRMEALNQGQVLEAERSGKHKTVSQLTAVIFTLFSMAWRYSGFVETVVEPWVPSGLGPVLNGFDLVLEYGPYWLMLLATILSITSGVDFIWKNRRLFGKQVS